MSAAPTNVVQLPTPRVLTPSERWQALVLAQMNKERADLCAPDQRALKAFFEMNANYLRSIANDRTATDSSHTRPVGTETKAPPPAAVAVPPASPAVPDVNDGALVFEVHSQRFFQLLRALHGAHFAVSNLRQYNRFRVTDAKEQSK